MATKQALHTRTYLILFALLGLGLQYITWSVTDTKTNMSHQYLGLARMMAADYGYSGTDHWFTDTWQADRSTLEAYSLNLDEQGLKLNAEQRPNFNMENAQPELKRTPGYPAFLYAIYRLFGEPLGHWASLIQALFGMAIPFLVFGIAHRLIGSRRIALWAAGLTVLSFPLAYGLVNLLPGGPTVVLVLLACWTLLWSYDNNSYMGMFATGLILACCAYFRPNVRLIFPFLGLALFIAQSGWKRPLLSTLLIMVGIHAGLAPWAMRNHDLTGRVIWGSTATGITIWKASAEFSPPWEAVRKDMAGLEHAQAQGFASDVSPDADLWYRQLMRQNWKNHPGHFLSASIKRLPFTLAPPFAVIYKNHQKKKGFFSYYLNEKGLNPLQVVLRHPLLVFQAYGLHLLVMFLGGLGTLGVLWYAFGHWRTQPARVALLLAVPIYFVAIHAPIIIQPRYLMPIIPFQMMGLAYIFARTHRWYRSRKAPLSPADSS